MEHNRQKGDTIMEYNKPAWLRRLHVAACHNRPIATCQLCLDVLSRRLDQALIDACADRLQNIEEEVAARRQAR